MEKQSGVWTEKEQMKQENVLLYRRAGPVALWTSELDFYFKGSGLETHRGVKFFLFKKFSTSPF